MIWILLIHLAPWITSITVDTIGKKVIEDLLKCILPCWNASILIQMVSTYGFNVMQTVLGPLVRKKIAAPQSDTMAPPYTNGQELTNIRILEAKKATVVERKKESRPISSPISCSITIVKRSTDLPVHSIKWLDNLSTSREKRENVHPQPINYIRKDLDPTQEGIRYMQRSNHIYAGMVYSFGT